MAEKTEILKQLKESGFQFWDNDDVKIMASVFGKKAVEQILSHTDKRPAGRARSIIKTSGFVFFRDYEEQPHSPRQCFRVSDISSFSHFAEDGTEYIKFTMNNGTTVKKLANTAMAQALIDLFYQDVEDDLVRPGADDYDNYGECLTL